MSDVISDRNVAYPKQPWLWNPDWAQGRALPADQPGTINGSIVAYRIVGAVTLAGSSCLIYLIVRTLATDEPFFPVGAVLWGLALLLGSLGLTAFYLGSQKARSVRRFGEVWLALDTNPALLGGKLQATLGAANGFSPDARASFDLVCSMHSSTATNMGNSYMRTLWRERMKSSASDGAIPVEFSLPEQLPESHPDVTSDEERCKWILLATVKCAEAGFAGRFEVPVFRRGTVARGENGTVAAGTMTSRQRGPST